MKKYLFLILLVAMLSSLNFVGFAADNMDTLKATYTDALDVIKRTAELKERQKVFPAINEQIATTNAAILAAEKEIRELINTIEREENKKVLATTPVADITKEIQQLNRKIKGTTDSNLKATYEAQRDEMQKIRNAAILTLRTAALSTNERWKIGKFALMEVRMSRTSLLSMQKERNEIEIIRMNSWVAYDKAVMDGNLANQADALLRIRVGLDNLIGKDAQILGSKRTMLSNLMKRLETMKQQ